jgi:hypothetical protein
MDTSMLTAQDAIMRLSAAELDYSVDQLAELARRSAISGAQEIAGAWYFPLADIDAFIYSRKRSQGRKVFWLVLLSTIFINGVVVNSLACYFFTARVFYIWPLVVITEFGLSLRGLSVADSTPTLRGIVLGSGACLLLIPLFLETCALVGGAP